MRLNPNAFAGFLNGIGQQFLWRRSDACPCYNPSSGAAKPNCPLCRGKGRLWAAPVSAVAGMTNQNVERKYSQFGRWEAGDSVITIGYDSPMYEAGEFDRLTLLNSTDVFTRQLKRGFNDVLYDTVVTIDRVIWLNTAGNAIVEGGIPTVAVDGTLTWPNGGEPPAGTQYTLRGTAYTEYYIWNKLPSDRNEHSGAPLPRKVLARKFDLFGR